MNETHHRANTSETAAAADSTDDADDFDTIKAECDTAAGAVEDTNAQMNLDLLEASLRVRHLTASFHKLTADHRAEISELVGRHGAATLVESAQNQHRPDSPARFVQAWLPTWREIPSVQISESRVRVKACAHGYVSEDEFGRAVLCSCGGSA